MTNSENGDGAEMALRWWKALNPENGVQSGAQRAALARLRRSNDTIDILREREGLRLVASFPPDRRERAALLAGVLAFVREDDRERIARAVGRTELDDDSSAKMSESRFRRLLQADEDDFMDSMRRIVRLTKGRCNVYDMSRSILYWGDSVRKRWIFDYYNVPPDAVFDSPSSTRREM